MKTMNVVHRDKTHLHQQLLVLIPLIKALEDHRAAEASPMPPLILEIEYHQSGDLTLDLGKAPANDDGRNVPDLTLTLYNGGCYRKPLTYQQAFITAWTYLSQSTPMNSAEYKAMYNAFFVSWYVHLFEYEQSIKEMGLA